MNKAHACDAVALFCIDYRIQRAITDFLRHEFPDSYDPISTAGGCKTLAASQFENRALDDIKTSLKLHTPKTVLLFQHEDCGAYGGSKMLGNIDIEREHHRRELQRAEMNLKGHIPGNIPVRKYFVHLSGEIKKIE